MTQPLLAGKFFIPPISSKRLSRLRLLEQLDRGLADENRLILVCAPAGYGKTTLVSEWTRQILENKKLNGQPAVSWLSIDEADNDPIRFFSYLAAAIQQAVPDYENPLPTLLASPQPSESQIILAALLNALVEIQTPLLIVLDDFQLIQAGEILEGLSFFLDHLSPGIHLLLASRVDPPISLHRYRARGQLVEVRARDLRFTEPEISTFIQTWAGYTPSEDEVAVLDLRTEGWAAGLQMAALSIRVKPDAREFIHSLAGSQRYILDYLLEEVFKAQPPQVQRFLLSTSILDRFSPALCAAILEETPQACQAIIEYLERSNLFLVPLDEAGQWRRYHHLFADLLRVRLMAAGQSGQESLADLHRRASAWFEAQGWTADAVQHAIQASEFERAAELVEQNTLALFAQGELQRLVAWVQMLPSGLAQSRPWLRIYQAWATTFAGRLVEANQLVSQIEAMLEAGAVSESDAQKMRAELAGVWGVIGIQSGRLDEVLALAEYPEEDLPAHGTFARSAVWWALGFAWRSRGDLSRAIYAFEQMLATGRQIGNLWTVVSASVDLGNVLRISGELRQAEAVYRSGLEAARKAENPVILGRLESFLAAVLYEQNEVAAARQFAQSSLSHNRIWQNPNHTVHGYLTQARIAWGLGEREAAMKSLAEAEATAAQARVVPGLQSALQAMRVMIDLERKDLASALSWAQSQPAHPPETFQDEAIEQIEVTRARVEIALGKAGDAYRRLASLEAAALETGRLNSLVEILILKALASPDPSTASQNLKQALQVGLPRGYRRSYLDAGPTLHRLLAEFSSSRQAGGPKPLDLELQVYLDRFLEVAGISSSEENPAGSGQSVLSAREVEILKNMAEGLTNAQIGARLYISTGTVKAHTAAIFRKLEVANRSEAVARAKDLGLV